MSLSTEQRNRLIAWFNHEGKHVCANCYHYAMHFRVCCCRDVENMIREANKCPDWRYLCGDKEPCDFHGTPTECPNDCPRRKNTT